MRRKTLLAGLALLGLSPGLALAQTTSPSRPVGAAPRAVTAAKPISADSTSDWISLKDEVELKATNRTLAAAPSSCGNCCAPSCGSCNPCGDVCSPCDPCGMGGIGLRRWDNATMGAWLNVDFLYWNISGYDTPPLVTTAPPGVIPQLGNPGVNVVLGNGEIGDDWRPGMRIRFGDWLDDTQSLGFEGHFFFLDQDLESLNFTSAGPGALSLGRPYFNIGNTPGGIFGGAGPGEAALINAFNDANGVVLDGSVNVRTSSDVYSAGVLLRHFLAEDTDSRIDFLGGYRFFRLDEGLAIRGTSVTGPNAPGFPIGFTFVETDVFDTENDFHGGELGLAIERDYGDLLSVEVVGKVALGSMRQQVDLQGTNVLVFPGFDPIASPSGLLVQPTNTGSLMSQGQFERDEFAVLPEVNINVGLQLTSQVRATAGWSVLYVDNVVRPGPQIDRVVNGTQIGGGALVGAARPAFNFNETDLWLYGANVGIEATY